MSFNIAIDGPAGAGKSTIAKRVARKMGYIYVDTGAMYRAMALYLIRNGISLQDDQAISAACQGADITIEYVDGEQNVFLNGENVSAYLRTEEVGTMASVSSANMDVRKKLVRLQQALAAKADVVMDGRDIGTCVLPQADIKIYLTASSRVRAKRRFEELASGARTVDLDTIERDIIERDHRDMTRDISPLKQAEDAVLLDTSEMNIEEVTKWIIDLVESKKREK